METTLEKVQCDEKETLHNLLQLCLHDDSEFDGRRLNESGIFDYAYLDFYWTEAGRDAFLIRAADVLAGFALVRRHEENGAVWNSLAEFFIARKYRRCGVGQAAAFAAFDEYSGLWRVTCDERNWAAQNFWRKIIGLYSENSYQETRATGGEMTWKLTSRRVP